ncbi:MAG: ABC transporter permease subunit [Angelakisella sp.]
MLAIIKREMRSYFSSPIGYVYIAVFFFFAGFYFFGTAVAGNSTDLSYVFSALFSICVFLIPILTMRLLSEDRKNKTDQLLLTSPVSLFSLVMGKYLSAAAVFLIGTAQTLVFALVIELFSTANWAMVFGHFIGISLLGLALIAIGMFISSVTENQVIAAVGGFAAGLALMMVDGLASMTTGWVSKLIVALSFNGHYLKFTQGLLDFADIIFFVSVAAVFIFFTIRVFERRRWN